jgi:hypothetical protein
MKYFFVLKKKLIVFRSHLPVVLFSYNADARFARNTASTVKT